MVAKIYSGTFIGLTPVLVTVEVDIQRGLPRFEIVGLAQVAIKESKNRVLSTLKNIGLDIGPKKVTVNLAPAHLKKDGSALDLPIALGVAVALGLIDGRSVDKTLAMGELSLAGELRKAVGALALMELARSYEMKRVILPSSNQYEALLGSKIQTLTASSFQDLIDYFQTGKPLAAPESKPISHQEDVSVDWSEIIGQSQAKRALEIAAAGHHNVLMIGPPGVGKTFTASRFVKILPDLDEAAFLERLRIYSFYNGIESHDFRPLCRMPHHSASVAGMIGGGRPFRPGELSLAHRGVLFMDEMTEFRRDILEVMRQPLESGTLEIVRSEYAFQLPADFILIGACNSCPCGNDGVKSICQCSTPMLRAHASKISSPIRDRFDLVVKLEKPSWGDVRQPLTSSTNLVVREKTLEARDRQARRYQGRSSHLNGRLSGVDVQKLYLNGSCQDILSRSMEKWNLSVRGVYKILRVSRTIADMAGEENISSDHLMEAMQFRSPEV